MSATDRPTSWWLDKLRQRRERLVHDEPALRDAPRFDSAAEQQAAVAFFNAAFRAEESGLRQAHELADEVAALDPELAEVLRLYGDEEGWHRELITEFLATLGGEVRPMGKTTRTLHSVYARARRMETIVLVNLVFESIGSTTYRLALGRVEHPSARRMLTILTRDESFHVPLNIHFLKRILKQRGPLARLRLRALHLALVHGVLLLPLASRPKAGAFDHIGRLELIRAYATELGKLFAREPELGLAPPWLALAALGISRRALLTGDDVSATSVEAAERAVDRDEVTVTAL